MLLQRRDIGLRLRFTALGVSALMLILFVSSLSAQGVSSIAQGFQTSDSNIVAGALVSLTTGTPNTVELSTEEKVNQLLGVAGSKSLIELSGGNGSVQVVTSGVTNVLVSDINGTIKVGDRITPSPVAGVGMRANFSALVIGTAQANLSGVKTRAQTITDTKGKQQTIHIGAIPVQVDKVFYLANGDQPSFLPSSIQTFANSIAGHEVSAVRVLIVGILITLLFVVVTVLLYSTVKSSIISIGRNPLSENAVHKSLLEVGVTIIGVLVCTIVVVYLILIT
ncbi:MAG TPA: hypothetical protein VLF91_06185 [Candidatus Saccharimonadales bacterium]|nr:hypothetical protein [Candidatus Saccharimonadales bacterium]